MNLQTQLQEGEQDLTHIWKATALRGALAIAFSVVILIWPNIGLATLTALLGAFALVSGVTTIAGAFSVPLRARAASVARLRGPDRRRRRHRRPHLARPLGAGAATPSPRGRRARHHRDRPRVRPPAQRRTVAAARAGRRALGRLRRDHVRAPRRRSRGAAGAHRGLRARHRRDPGRRRARAAARRPRRWRIASGPTRRRRPPRTADGRRRARPVPAAGVTPAAGAVTGEVVAAARQSALVGDAPYCSSVTCLSPGRRAGLCSWRSAPESSSMDTVAWPAARPPAGPPLSQLTTPASDPHEPVGQRTRLAPGALRAEEAGGRRRPLHGPAARRISPRQRSCGVAAGPVGAAVRGSVRGVPRRAGTALGRRRRRPRVAAWPRSGRACAGERGWP